MYNLTYHVHYCLQNAEMSFNFGEKPFKYGLPDGYNAINTATKDKVVTNTNGETVAASSSKPISNAPQAIIIEPSRELAEQTYEQIKKFKKYLETPKINELLVIGGVNIRDQINTLQNEGVNIVVGTPGRLDDLIGGGIG